ncbi:MAG TPA: lasso peptide biosynthesis PqqD family chaperone [Bacilli bacterium]
MRNQSINPDDLVVQAKDLLVSNMDGEKVMMSIQSGKYYNLGRTGGAIWDMMESPVAVRKLLDNLTETYDIDAETCKEQLLDFLRNLLREHLIQIGTPAATGS